MRTSLASYDAGRWIAECPEPGCNDARLVYEINPRTGVPTGRRLTEDVCANGHPFRIDMPPKDTEAQIVTALSGRAERDQYWYPRGHVRATLTGQPTGQSVSDLEQENHVVAQARSAEQVADQDRLREILTGLGVTVNDDGSFTGSI